MYSRIKALCKKKGISVSGLEVLLGFSRGSICKWDNCKPSVDRVAKVANYFGVPINYFLENSGGVKDKTHE